MMLVCRVQVIALLPALIASIDLLQVAVVGEGSNFNFMLLWLHGGFASVAGSHYSHELA